VHLKRGLRSGSMSAELDVVTSNASAEEHSTARG
jgi:hypothetical protein